MKPILHLSDPHFGQERPEVVSALLRLHERLQPELVVVSGDLTQRAWPYQFERARAFLAQLNAQALLVIPGNHDVPIFNLFARLTAPYGLYKKAVNENLEPVFCNDSLLVIGVDTSTPQRRVDGEVTPAQVERVCARLRAASATQLRLVVVHQPVAVPGSSERQRLLHGAQLAVPAWVAAGADVILGGHIHLPYVLPLGDAFAELERDAWVVHAGTAVSDRLRMDAPNSVNELRYDAAAARLRVVQWDYQNDAATFVAANCTELALDRRA